MSNMLSDMLIRTVLEKLPSLRIGVVGDLFLDEYLEIDDTLTEPSIETGLSAYQVTSIRHSPGAAGTILNNLAALGVGKIHLLSFIGADGRGHDVKNALMQRGIDVSYLLETPLRHTPTYTKPMLNKPGAPSRELNRLDIKNRTETPGDVQLFLYESLPRLWKDVDALLVLDQVSVAETGVITSMIRHQLAELGQSNPDKLLLCDSRERIGQFSNCWAKPNLSECKAALNTDSMTPEQAARALAFQLHRPVFCTSGEEGIFLAARFTHDVDCSGIQQYEVRQVPGYAVIGPIDIVGAGDSTSAGIACAVASGASLTEAAAFGNLIASITIQQLGTTGTATPKQVWERWKQVS